MWVISELTPRKSLSWDSCSDVETVIVDILYAYES